MFSLKGEQTGNLDLPREIFGQEVNISLLSQAMRVYQNNQKGHFGNTKTRGEVEGSTRKIFKQKHTGRARHGSIMAPIFVGGGIALGPKFRKVVLELPKKMKKGALIASLSKKAADKQIVAIDGLDKSKGKTKEMAMLFKKLDQKSALVITGANADLTRRAVRNLTNFAVTSADQLNAFEVVRYPNLVITKEALDLLNTKFKGETK